MARDGSESVVGEPAYEIGVLLKSPDPSFASDCPIMLSSPSDSCMDVTIPKSLQALIRRKVDEGRYSTEDEVVADTLRLMQGRDETVRITRSLQDAIERGYDDIDEGSVISLEAYDQSTRSSPSCEAPRRHRNRPH